MLARNAAVHRNLADYLEKVKSPRFVDEDCQFWVDLDSYRLVVAGVKEFVTGLSPNCREPKGGQDGLQDCLP